MASSEVDQKFLGRLALSVERSNPLLSNILFKILGLSIHLAKQLLLAKRLRPRSRRQQSRPSHPFHTGVDSSPGFRQQGLGLVDVKPDLDGNNDAIANAYVHVTDGLDAETGSADTGPDWALDPARVRQYLDLAYHVLWLSREGLNLIEQYVIPWAGHNVELTVLAYKLRASFLHIYVLFYNQPPVSRMSACDPDMIAAAAGLQPPSMRYQTSAQQQPVRDRFDLPLQVQSSPSPASFQQRKRRGDKGKRSMALYDEDVASTMSSLQPTHQLEGGNVADSRPRSRSRSHSYSRSFSPSISPPLPFLMPQPSRPLKPFVVPRIIVEADYVPVAHDSFKKAAYLACEYLWGSHTLRLSVMTEYVAFLYDCLHEPEASRRMARDAITEVYEAQEGMDDDMFEDACQFVAVLGRMKRRGQMQPQTETLSQIQNQSQAQAQTQFQNQTQAQTQTQAQPQIWTPPQSQSQSHEPPQPQSQAQLKLPSRSRPGPEQQPHQYQQAQYQQAQYQQAQYQQAQYQQQVQSQQALAQPVQQMQKAAVRHVPLSWIPPDAPAQAQATAQLSSDYLLRWQLESESAMVPPGRHPQHTGYRTGYEAEHSSPARSPGRRMETASSMPPPGMENPI